MICYLIRHGRTQSNVDRKYAGCRTDDDLLSESHDELRGQADLYLSASNDPTLMLVSSPMKRAVQTSEVLFPGRHKVIIEELREMDFGIFDGRSHDEMDGDPIYQEWIDSGCTLPIPEGESMASFTARSMDGFRESVIAAKENGANNLCIVAHGGNIMSIMSSIFEGNYYDFYSHNGEGYSFELEVDDAGNIISAGPYDRICCGVRA